MYMWEGETIKLNAQDFKKARQNYPNLDLNLELGVLDAEFSHSPPKNWYVPMLKKLAYQERKARERGQQSTRQRTLTEDLTDRSWADNVVKLEAK